ncbi:hypothetical protein PHLH6_48190 [Pseudomonas sp. Seg1]|uniref:hypothetical protein n=1 Tax=Pseudomonas sp. Seg1 TaxID=2678259 RepID=UPI001BB32373|nr:hypothetical protein [Pseudomonas sp. Seg1]BBP72815.1 hypothetical protein PHLH6_48190 [Pseudomonas sp. Seg1]
MYQQYKNYFTSTDDIHAHFFEISASPYPSFFYEESLTLGSGSLKIHIIDQFCGKRPALFNHQFCTNNSELELQFWCSITLDSHVASLLHEYVENPEALSSESHQTAEEFILHLAEKKFDFSPIFYVTESYLKSTPDNFNRHIPKVLTSILKLQAMCEKTFIEHREIKIKPDAIAYYCDLYKQENLRDCANAWAQEIAARINREDTQYIVDFTYACLLKMVLIKFADNRGIVKKCEQFEKFMIDELGIRLARESGLALCYFSGLADKLVNTQANKSLTNAIHDLKATAWDMFLLKMPEISLTPNHLPEIKISYVATSEKKLYELGKLFDVQHLACRTDDAGTGLPLISFSMESVNEKNDDIAVQKLIMASEEMAFRRMAVSKIIACSPDKLKAIIFELESQLSNFCQ